MSYSFRVNRFRSFLRDVTSANRAAQNIESTDEATLLQRCWGITQTERPDLITSRARVLCRYVCRELDGADQDNNEYCLLLSNLADAIDGFRFRGGEAAKGGAFA